MKRTPKALRHLAVLLIDMQEKFVSNLRPGARETIVPEQLKMIGWCAKHDVPLVMIKMRPDEFGEIIPELQEAAQHVRRVKYVTKKYDNAFVDTWLKDILRWWRIHTLVLMGINADYCIYETAKRAIELGFSIVTARDLIAGQDDHSADDSAKWFGNNGTLRNKAKQLTAAIAKGSAT